MAGVLRHQSRLSHGGTGLEFGQFGRAFLIAEQSHAGPDRATAHDDNLLSGRARRGDLCRKLLQLRRINLLPSVGQYARAQFDDNTGGIFQRITMHKMRIRKEPPPENAKI
jgi:hypothetical protein